MADELHFSEAHPPANHELLLRIERYLDGVASEAEVALLNQDLIARPDNRDLFVRLSDLSGSLEEHFAQARAHADVESILKEVASSQRKASTPIVGLLGWTNHTFNRALVWSILTVAVGFYGAFAIISWNLRLENVPGRIADHNLAVAQIHETKNVKWSAATKPKSSATTIRAGELLRIDAGVVELKLKSGATLLVEGPAEWAVDDENVATLSSGRLLAQVPGPAVGFTLHTPAAEVVDLGTEFGVHVNDKGETEVQMLSGSAHVKIGEFPGKGQTTPRNSYKLAAGDAMRVRPAAATTSAVGEFVKPRPEQIAAWKELRRQVKSGSRPKLKLVSGGKPVTADSVYDGGPDYPHKFPASAITDGRLNDAPDSWWISADKVLQSYLIIDLEAAYTIAEIRLQNTHHGTWEDRATKDFRLLISMNGQDFFPVTEGTLASVNGIDSPPFERFSIRPVVRGRYVKFEALSFYGLSAGLNELQVFAVDEEGGGQDGNAPPAAK